ncbi:hypothetical protein [Paraburkholderia acidipaludis]|uniref:hypothetical protein n=1 Tax=Paraburkholderia acidipaludis TaxID=660537 RepID=UPI0012EB7F22|nr:hypothetical protein [Paraburkholderia acidipaludis]
MSGASNPAKSGKVTPKHDTKGIEVSICQVSWFDKTSTFTIANSPARTAALSFSGDDLNYFARVLYAESSGAGALPDLSDRKQEKEALINVFYFRLNRKGYPTNHYVATTFTMVCNAPNQFQSVMPHPAAKLVKSADPGYASLNKAECSDLQESIDAIRDFISAGPNAAYTYDNFRAGSSGTHGTTIGGSRFWLSTVGKGLSDATP